MSFACKLIICIENLTFQYKFNILLVMFVTSVLFYSFSSLYGLKDLTLIALAEEIMKWLEIKIN